MSDTTCCNCVDCATTLERTRYFPRQLITADDMRAEQEFFLDKLRRHNRFLHGWGVVCGCAVLAQPVDAHPWQVQICPGYIVVPQGDEIVIRDCVSFDLLLGAQPADPCAVTWPCPPQPVFDPRSQWKLAYLAVRYVECATRPVRVHPAGCGCDQLDCEYSRVRESFELKLLWALPESHVMARKADAAWADAAREGFRTAENLGYPVPPCPPCCDDPWVILATIRIPGATAGAARPPITDSDIAFTDRRVLYGTTALETLVEVGI